jgi:hypothetical protein
MAMTVRFGLVFAACVVSACSRYELAATWNDLRGDSYPLDEIPREVPEGGVAACPPELTIVKYSGEIIPYRAPVEVAEPFVPKLRRFENVVAELAIEHYGRPPDRLLHFGARACRSVRGNRRRLSEHALANALDLSGFEWQRVRGQADASSTPKSPQAFVVSILQHWAPKSGDPELLRHQHFLQALVKRVQRDDLFRGVIGPGREGHANHLHLDQSPWSYWLF